MEDQTLCKVDNEFRLSSHSEYSMTLISLFLLKQGTKPNQATDKIVIHIFKTLKEPVPYKEEALLDLLYSVFDSKLSFSSVTLPMF